MATATTGWTVGDGGENNGKVKGLGQIGGGDGSQGIYDVSTTQNFPLGYKLEFDDGREFRYSHFVSAVGPGKLAAQDFSLTGLTSDDGVFVNSAGTGTDQAIGATTVYMKSSNITSDDLADIYAGGYLHITDDVGEGHVYRIKSNNVGGEVETNTMKFELYDGLVIAVVSEASGSVTGNPYRNLAINDANVDAIIAGGTLVDVAAAEYAWVQKKGVGTVLADGAVASAGTVAQASDGVNGAAQVLGGGAIDSEDDHSYHLEPIIGVWLDNVATGEYGPIKFNLA